MEPDGQTASLERQLSALGLSSEFLRRPEVGASERLEGILAFHTEELAQNRNFATGLLFATVSLAEVTLDRLGLSSQEAFFTVHPPENVYRSGRNRGRPVENLLLIIDGRELSLRGFYDRFTQVVRGTLTRYSYPNSPLHATRAWRGSREVLEMIFALSPEERATLARSMWDTVLALPSGVGSVAGIRTPRPFEILLRDFHQAPGIDPPGAVLQGLVFSYYRADAPNVTGDKQVSGGAQAAWRRG